MGFFILETETQKIRLLNMNVLTTTLDPQPLVIVPRSTTFDELIFTDDSTNIPVVIEIDSVEDKSYYQILNVFCELVENRFYNVELFNDGALIYRGKVFCTDQTIVNFSVNKGRYTSHATTNQYITYE